MICRQQLARAAALAAVALGVPAASGQASEQVQADLAEIIGLHGWPCAEVTGYEPQGADEYVVLCGDGNRYQVYMATDWRWGGVHRQTGLKTLLDVTTQTERLSKGDPSDRQAAAEELAGLGPAAKAAVPHLIQALADQDGAVRSGAAQALGEIGPAAEAAVPDLIEALKDQEPEVRESARQALTRIRAR